MRVIYWFAVLMIAAGTLAWCALPAGAQGPKSLDEQLLEDLTDDPVDELDRELFGPDARQQRPGLGPEQDPGGRLRRELGAGAEEANPLLEIARQMRDVARYVGQSDSGPATQNVQKQIVADLEKLIEQARKQCKACSKPGSSSQQTASRGPVGQPRPKSGEGGSKSSNRPSTDSSRRRGGQGETRRPDMAEMRELLKQLWGELPAHAREQMLQSPPEEFLPKYELLIEEYFRRLSEEE